MENTKIYNTKIDTNIYETNDYDMFKTLKGNRDIMNDTEIAKIMNSLKDNGWIGAPTVVNENYETIDGQKRTEACRRLNIPVRYMIMPGLRIEHCIALNTNQKNWKLDDYIKSFCEQDYEDYIWAVNTHKLYPSIDMTMILELASGTGYRTNLSGPNKDTIQRGGLDISVERREHVIKVLDFLSKFTDATAILKGRKFLFYNALIWWFFESKCDETRLVKSVNKYIGNPKILGPKLTTDEYVYAIQDAYNHNKPASNHLHIKDKYDSCSKYYK